MSRGGGVAVTVALPAALPASVKKTIEDLKEIAKGHSDEDIYAALKECSMDPNETAQKLLSQDYFHEVKRKRDKRKEVNSARDPADTKPRQGNQGRGGRVGRAYPMRYNLNGNGRGSNVPRENGNYQAVNKTNTGPSASQVQPSQTAPTKSASATSSQTAASDGTNVPREQILNKSDAPVQTGKWRPTNANNSVTDASKQNSVNPQSQATTGMGKAPGETVHSRTQQTTSASSETPAPIGGVYSSSDPVLVRQSNSRTSGPVGTIKREIGPNVAADRQVCEQSSSTVESVSSTTKRTNSLQTSQSERASVSDLDAKTQVSSSAATGYVVNRSSVMTNPYPRSQQPVVPQKAVGATKEWKPKTTTVKTVGVIGTSTENSRSPSPDVKAPEIDDNTLKVQKKMDELSVRQDIVIPDHYQVPESQRTGFIFGSFDSDFTSNIGVHNIDIESDKSSNSRDETPVADEAVEEPSPSMMPNSDSTSPKEHYKHSQESGQVVDSISPSNEAALETNEIISQPDSSKPEVAPQPIPQLSVMQTATSYPGVSLVPQIIGSQYPTYEHSEPQLRDISRLPFVQPTYDPSTSYYTPFVRPSTDGDSRFSPFIGSTAANKFSGNAAVLSGQNVSTSQESGNSLVLSNAGPTALATQPTGVVQTTLPLPQQQPLHVFRQPTGVHIPHFPPNYLPYQPIISPYYVPSPAMHNFVGNSAFPQVPAGSSYNATAAAGGGASYPTAPSVKYQHSQYKPGSGGGNSPHIGVPAAYGNFTTAPSGYSGSPAVTAGNSPACEDIGASQFKDNNVYVAGQQGEGSTIWYQGPPRELSGIQASSYYNIPPQGQHVQFAHTQGGHAAFPGLYHPSQSGAGPSAHPLLQQTQALGGAVGVVGAQTVYQQSPQRAQLNWSNNY